MAIVGTYSSIFQYMYCNIAILNTGIDIQYRRTISEHKMLMTGVRTELQNYKITYCNTSTGTQNRYMCTYTCTRVCTTAPSSWHPGHHWSLVQAGTRDWTGHSMAAPCTAWHGFPLFPSLPCMALIGGALVQHKCTNTRTNAGTQVRT